MRTQGAPPDMPPPSPFPGRAAAAARRWRGGGAALLAAPLARCRAGGCGAPPLARTNVNFVQILKPATGDGPPVVTVHAEYERYLFNCPEGTQRTLSEGNFSKGKIRNVFFTRLAAENHLGLAEGFRPPPPPPPPPPHHGWAVESEGGDVETGTNGSDLAHKRNILSNIFRGPTQKEKETSRSRHSAMLKDVTRRRVAFAFRTLAAASSVDPAMFLGQPPEMMLDGDGAVSGAVPDPLGYRTSAVEAEPDSAHSPSSEEGSRAGPMPEVVCYICHRPITPGRVDVEAAERLGVAHNRGLAELTYGRTVYKEDGEEVHPHQVLGPPKLGPVSFVFLRRLGDSDLEPAAGAR
ncbi:MAG: hypothetical protein BJ554DRAFT_7460 [Olpidium bornovanus]|uniref:ribonuclease Z n=1 Tax=Olpidium bornovanus TaxID=278681 RepID=A0A8H7ZWK1_9FUNG|nr:MAG: hypothetical protein BJ554DRAFT_7460 [Olpidium bornovanus]